MSGQGSPDATLGHESRRRGTVLIVCETRDGRAIKSSLELVGQACTLSNRFADCAGVDAVVWGEMEEPGVTLGSVGVDTAYHCTAQPAINDPLAFVATLGAHVREHSPLLILCAHTLWGAEIAVRLAVELDAPLISNCVQVLDASGGGLRALQSVQDGRLCQECSCTWQGPAIVSWNPDSLGPSQLHEGRSAQVKELKVSCVVYTDAVRPVRIIQGNVDSMSLDEADRILAFGRGVDPADLPLLQELASSLKASIGGTRPVIDAGLLPFERQIGQTGISVSPKLLMAWGISGANEFTVGIEEAETILSVNTDPQARMFMFSDLGLVGDGKTILRLLMEKLKQSDDGAGTCSGGNP